MPLPCCLRRCLCPRDASRRRSGSPALRGWTTKPSGPSAETSSDSLGIRRGGVGFMRIKLIAASTQGNNVSLVFRQSAVTSRLQLPFVPRSLSVSRSRLFWQWRRSSDSQLMGRSFLSSLSSLSVFFSSFKEKKKKSNAFFRPTRNQKREKREREKRGKSVLDIFFYLRKISARHKKTR